MSHTPGPWTVEDSPDSEWPEVNVDDWPIMLPCTNGQLPERTREVASANARLIAAAPELLDLLKNAAKALDLTIVLAQAGFDSAPEPATKEDYENAVLVGAINNLVRRVEGTVSA